MQPASSFKIFDRVLKPDYILVIQYPNESRQPVITTLNMHSAKFRKKQVEPFPVLRDDITIRKYYKPIIEKPDYVMESKMLVGTVEGKSATWPIIFSQIYSDSISGCDACTERNAIIIPEFINIMEFKCR